MRDKKYKITTKIYWIINDIHDFPKCEIDKKPIMCNINNLRDGYNNITVCSKKCRYIKMKNSLQKTMIKLYGVDNISKLDSIKIKKEQTTFKNYGVKNPS